MYYYKLIYKTAKVVIIFRTFPDARSVSAVIHPGLEI